MQIRTVLCPIDFTDVASREIDVAVEVCCTFGARLVLHHNVAAVGAGFARAWDWDATHRASEPSLPAAERRMQEILSTVGHRVAAEAVVTAGPLATIVLALAEHLPADLVVLGSHGWSTADHASVTERVVERAPCPVLTFQEGGEGPSAFRLRAPEGGPPLRVLVPTDLSSGSAAAVAHACDLARTLGLRVDVLHVAPDASRAARAADGLAAAIPAEARHLVEVHLRSGAPADEILAHIRETAPAFAIVGTHARGFMRRLFTHDTARELIHRSRCPVWVVPDRAARGSARPARDATVRPN
jgi:nucleotide-binding universal stress UspA family protein